MPKSYSEKLRSPKWQKLRLKVLERDEYTCQFCGNTEEELQVHHLAYEKGKDPGEEKIEDLITACAGCHAWAEGLLKATRKHMNNTESLSNLNEFLSLNFADKTFMQLVLNLCRRSSFKEIVSGANNLWEEARYHQVLSDAKFVKD